MVPPVPVNATITALPISKFVSAINSSRIHFISRVSMFPVTIKSVTLVFSVAVSNVPNVPAVVTLIVFDTIALVSKNDIKQNTIKIIFLFINCI